MAVEFTSLIPDEDRKDTAFEHMENWDEEQAKNDEKACCHDCDWFDRAWIPCSAFIGMYHKPCDKFEQW